MVPAQHMTMHTMEILSFDRVVIVRKGTQELEKVDKDSGEEGGAGKGVASMDRDLCDLVP